MGIKISEKVQYSLTVFHESTGTFLVSQNEETDHVCFVRFVMNSFAREPETT